MNRLKLIAGDKVANRMSPVNLAHREEITVRVELKQFIIYMVLLLLDYLDLYKWFIPTRQGLAKLDFIGELELNKSKNENPHDTFKEFYEKDFSKVY